MARYETSLDATYFDRLYAADPDPWRFATSAYEAKKYAATLAALAGRRYGTALEIGCSIGVLTLQLAESCDHLLALDISRAALEQARTRCASKRNVRFEQASVPGQWPAGAFDLILLSEVVYYLDTADVESLAARAAASLRPGGVIVLVHWLGETHYPLSGDDAADLFIGSAGSFALPSHQDRTDDYRLDVLRSTVAAAAAGA